MSLARVATSALLGAVAAAVSFGLFVVLATVAGVGAAVIGVGWIPTWAFALPLPLALAGGGFVAASRHDIGAGEDVAAAALGSGLAAGFFGAGLGVLVLVLGLSFAPAGPVVTDPTRSLLQFAAGGGTAGAVGGAVFGAVGGAAGSLIDL